MTMYQYSPSVPSRRSPRSQQPITIVLKAIPQKVLRRVYCLECAWPLVEITDKVVIVYEGTTPIEELKPNNIGLVEVHCKQSNCKQYYRLEFAV